MNEWFDSVGPLVLYFQNMQRKAMVQRFYTILFLFVCSLSAFADDIEIRHAKNFSIEVRNDCYVVSVNNAYKGAGDRTFRYVLQKSKNPAVCEFSDAMHVVIPVKRVIGLSTTFLSPIDLLGEVDSLVGIGSFKYTNTESIIRKIEKKELVDVGSESAKNIELIVSLDPDLVFTNAIGNPDHDIHPVLNQMEIPSALTAAYMEETLLGRAEWIKFVAAFYDKIDLAERIFSQTEQRYEELLKVVDGVEVRPTVFTNAPWGNVWYTPSGLSYTAKALADAGAEYLWKDDRTDGSLPLDFETVYEKAVEADFWLNTNYLNTIEAVKSTDLRYGDFRSVIEGNLFSETKRLNEYGGNDIWERGFTHPDEVLADLIKIFHPTLLPDHELIYYKKVQ